MSLKLDTLEAALHSVLGDAVARLERVRGELTLTVKAADYLQVATTLRDHAQLRFELLIDLCGMDYSAYKDGAESVFIDGPRYAAVLHLLSVEKNWRLRVRVFAPDDELPIVASVNPVWN